MPLNLTTETHLLYGNDLNTSSWDTFNTLNHSYIVNRRGHEDKPQCIGFDKDLTVKTHASCMTVDFATQNRTEQNFILMKSHM